MGGEHRQFTQRHWLLGALASGVLDASDQRRLTADLFRKNGQPRVGAPFAAANAEAGNRTESALCKISNYASASASARRGRPRDSDAARSVRFRTTGAFCPTTSRRWQPPEGLAPEDVLAIITAAATERDRLLLRVLCATGARISEALALRAMDVQRDALILRNRKNPNLLVKRVFLPQGQADLPGALLLWAREQALADKEPLFFSRKHGPHGERRAITRGQAWLIVRHASECAEVRVLALRPSRFGVVGQPAPVHPHLFWHARVRKIVRDTRSLPLAQRQAGRARLQTTYLTLGDDKARRLMRQVTE